MIQIRGLLRRALLSGAALLHIGHHRFGSPPPLMLWLSLPRAGEFIRCIGPVAAGWLWCEAAGREMLFACGSMRLLLHTSATTSSSFIVGSWVNLVRSLVLVYPYFFEGCTQALQEPCYADSCCKPPCVGLHNDRIF
jgi:hypothetical protein